MIVNAWSVKKGLVVCAALLLTTSAHSQGFRGMGGSDREKSSVRVESGREDRQSVERQDTGRQVQGDSSKDSENLNAVSEKKATNTNRVHVNRGNTVQRNQTGTGMGMNTSTVQRGEIRNNSNRSESQQGRLNNTRTSNHVRTVGRTENGSVRQNAFGHPAAIRNKSEILRTNRAQSMIRLPNEGPNHQKFQGRVLSSAPRMQHMAPLRNTVILGHVRNYDRLETAHNRYYWHNDGGYRFCHYYDDWGYHWYGWYAGDDFFWTRYFSGRWWWYDSGFGRWCYWHDNGWWWQDPALGTVFIYSNNAYTPAEESADETTTTAGSPSNAESHTEFWDAADSRVVKVYGQDAFLYDTNNPPRFDPMFLSSKVSDVKFSKSKNGRPAQIMLTLEDGSFLLFDGDGNPYK